jgi:hypothetical protein
MMIGIRAYEISWDPYSICCDSWFVSSHIVRQQIMGFIYQIDRGSMLRTKYQYSIEKPQKSTQHLEKEIISDNNPLRGGNLLLPHLNVQVQDDSK